MAANRCVGPIIMHPENNLFIIKTCHVEKAFLFYYVEDGEACSNEKVW